MLTFFNLKELIVQKKYEKILKSSYFILLDNTVTQKKYLNYSFNLKNKKILRFFILQGGGYSFMLARGSQTIIFFDNFGTFISFLKEEMIFSRVIYVKCASFVLNQKYLSKLSLNKDVQTSSDLFFFIRLCFFLAARKLQFPLLFNKSVLNSVLLPLKRE